MPLQVRRGTNLQRTSMTEPLASGELLYVTDTGALYIGNGSTVGGVPIANITGQDVRDLAAGLFTSGAHTGISYTYDSELGTIDSVVDVDLSNYQGVIRASSFNGTLVADDSSVLVDALIGKIELDGTVKGNIVPDADSVYDLGSNAAKFKDLYLSGTSIFLGDANITSTGTAVNLPSGSTVGGIPIGSGSGSGVIEGSQYKIDIVGDDSVLIVNSSTREVSATTLSATTLSATTLSATTVTSNTAITDVIKPLSGAILTVGAVDSTVALDIKAEPSQSLGIYGVTSGFFDGGGPITFYGHSTSLSTPSAIVAEGTLGAFAFNGYNGTDYGLGAIIIANVDAGVTLTGGETFIPSNVIIGTSNGTNIDVALTVRSDQVTESPCFKATPFADATARDAAITAPEAGMVVYITSTNKLQCFNGSTWNDLF